MSQELLEMGKRCKKVIKNKGDNLRMIVGDDLRVYQVLDYVMKILVGCFF